MGLRSWWKKDQEKKDAQRVEQAEEMLRDENYGKTPEEALTDAASAGHGGQTMKGVTRLGEFE